MSVMRELKAKKALFGFVADVGSTNLLELGMFLATALRGAQLNKDFTMESSQSGGSHELKVYTNDASLAAHIRIVNSLHVPCNTQAFLDGGNLFDRALQEQRAIGDALGGPNA